MSTAKVGWMDGWVCVCVVREMRKGRRIEMKSHEKKKIIISKASVSAVPQVHWVAKLRDLARISYAPYWACCSKENSNNVMPWTSDNVFPFVYSSHPPWHCSQDYIQTLSCCIYHDLHAVTSMKGRGSRCTSQVLVEQRDRKSVAHDRHAPHVEPPHDEMRLYRGQISLRTLSWWYFLTIDVFRSVPPCPQSWLFELKVWYQL